MGKFNPERRNFMRTAIAGSVGLSVSANAIDAKPAESATTRDQAAKPEWRNRKPGMTYRMFGNTGMMVSEIVVGTTPWSDETHFPMMDAAIERGINYIDTAPAYSRGEAERLVGKYITRTGTRDQLFISTKLSHYDEFHYGLIEDVLKGLPQEKRNAIEKRADDLIHQRGVMKPGYHFTYFGAQARKYKTGFIQHLVLEEYGRMQAWKPKIKAHMRSSMEKSLKAVQTDYFDVLHCPHGVPIPEMLDDENIREIFDEFKRKGIARFNAFSAHNDVAGNLAHAIELGYYDGAMVAYNIANHAALDTLIAKAKNHGMGIVAMKVAKIIDDADTPQWRIDKLNAAVEEELSLHAKGYLWALQNPNISCCVSNLSTPAMVAENAGVTGRRIEFGQV
ncbi:MAG: aldo/keto reductase [Puniceicoccaceae bacterium]